MSMREAVARFAPDGASICMGTALEALIPFAAGHELIRQRRRDLTLIGPISDILFDQLIGAGCVRRVIAAWVGNVSAGLGHNYRRAAERGIPATLEVQDHSNLPIAFALQAAALGVPYLPTRSLLGTDLPRANPTFKEAADPWSGAPLLLVPAIAPDVAILHVQRADEEGHAHVWGTLGVTRPAAFAARQVILVAEEIRPRERILSDPGLGLTPALKVAAVVHPRPAARTPAAAGRGYAYGTGRPCPAGAGGSAGARAGGSGPRWGPCWAGAGPRGEPPGGAGPRPGAAPPMRASCATRRRRR